MPVRADVSAAAGRPLRADRRHVHRPGREHLPERDRGHAARHRWVRRRVSGHRLAPRGDGRVLDSRRARGESRRPRAPGEAPRHDDRAAPRAPRRPPRRRARARRHASAHRVQGPARHRRPRSLPSLAPGSPAVTVEASCAPAWERGPTMFDADAIERIKAMRRDWEANELREFLARQPESRSEYRTGSGLPVERVYTPADIADTGFEEIGLPGRYPFTRGPYPTMYRGRLWTMRQIAGYGTGSDTNARFHYLIAQGQTGLSVDFDMPTLMGYDSDDPRAVGEVGREGVAVDTLDDVEALFAGIDLERISVSMTINPTAWILLAMYVALARSRGDDPNKLSGTCQTDILKEYIAQKEWIFPIRPTLRLVRDIIVYCAEHMARYKPMNNVVRTALQALAAVLGGAQSLHTNGLDEAYAIPSELAMKIALRTQQIIADETRVTAVVDPLGGSYYVEALTSRIEAEVAAILRKVDALGGTVKAIEEGYFQREIADSAYAQARRKASGAEPVIGVNKFVEPPAPGAVEIHRVDPAVEARQIERLRATRASRDHARVAALLERLAREAADPAVNLIPVTIELVEARASMGEIVGRLRHVWGQYVETPVF